MMQTNERLCPTIFDYLPDDCGENLDNQIISDSMAADSRKITDMTFRKIGLRTQTRKKKTKTIITAWIAAALTVMLLGAVLVGASEDITVAFSEYIAGEPADGVFSGGNVIQYSDIVNIDFHGITGDEHTASAFMKFTRQDGEPLIDEELIQDKDSLIIENQPVYNPFRDDWYQTDEGWHNQTDVYPFGQKNISCTVPFSDWIENTMGHRSFNDGFTACEYTFRDSRTLDYYSEYYNSGANIKGQQLSLGAENIYVSHIDQVLYTQDDFTDFAQWESFRTNPDTYKMLNEQWKEKLKENQCVRITPGWQKIVIASRYTVPLHYHVSVRLNYRTIDRELLGQEQTILSDGNSYTFCSLTAGAFSMKLRLRTSLDVLQSENSAGHPFEHLIVTLKDGTVLVADCHTLSGSSTDNHTACLEQVYSYTEKSQWDKGIYTRYTLDPENILSVTAGHDSLQILNNE